MFQPLCSTAFKKLKCASKNKNKDISLNVNTKMLNNTSAFSFEDVLDMDSEVTAHLDQMVLVSVGHHAHYGGFEGSP